jgi:uncharacterized protein YbaP (TraB family)
MNIAETLAASIGRGVRRTIATALIAASALGAPALAQPAMWAVKDADSTIYLFGTVHLLKPETQWKTPKLEAAIKEAEQLWLELPTTNAEQLAPQMMPLITQFGLAPATPLSSNLTADEMKTLDEAAKLAGMTGAQLDIFRPWFAALTISTSAMVRAGFRRRLQDRGGLRRTQRQAERSRNAGVADQGVRQHGARRRTRLPARDHGGL